MGSSSDDWELLHAYAADRSETAFTILVSRHIGLVYAAARRRLGNAHMAEDVTQAVFITLARKASRIRPGTPLPLWLFNTVRFTAANAMKIEQRRRFHETRAAAMRATAAIPTAGDEDQLSSLLDAGMDRLAQRDRAVILLRYFKGLSHAEVATSLGIKPHAAEARASRAVEKLRRHFASQGASVPSAAIVTTLAARSGDSAPMGLSASVSAGALGTIPTSAAVMAIGRASMIGALAKIAVVGCVFLALLVTPIFFVYRFLNNADNVRPVLVSVTTPPAAAQADPLTPVIASVRPPPPGVDAAALVRKVWNDEAWVDHVKSLHLTFRDIWTHTPAGVAEMTAQLRRLMPGVNVSPASNANLRLRSEGTVEVAFDQKRLYSRFAGALGEIELLNVWDGRRAFGHAKYDSGQDGYWFSKGGRSGYIEAFFGETGWPDAGPHHYWWSFETPEQLKRDFGTPEDYRVLSRASFNGHDCYILDFDGFPWRSMYVGIADQRLYGLTNWAMSNSWPTEAQRRVVAINVAAKFGLRISTEKEFRNWENGLSADKQGLVERERDAQTRKYAVPMTTLWYDNYRAVAPGCWMPMSMGYTLTNDMESRLDVIGHRQLRVTSVLVDSLLPESMFTMAMQDGVQVNDWTHDPPLFYKYKHDMTAAEWDKILADAQQQKERQLSR